MSFKQPILVSEQLKGCGAIRSNDYEDTDNGVNGNDVRDFDELRIRS